MEEFCSVCGNSKVDEVDYCLHCGSTEFVNHRKKFLEENKNNNIMQANTGWVIFCLIAGAIMLPMGLILEESFIIVLAFVELSSSALMYWALNEKEKMNIDTEEYKQASEIFELCSSENFNHFFNEIAKILFCSTSFQITKTFSEESKAALNERKRREVVEYYTSNIEIQKRTIKNIRDVLKKWEKAKVRPEIIVERLINILAEKNKVKASIIKENYVEGLKEILDKFDEAYNKEIKWFVKQSNNVRNESKIAHDNKNVTGLNYGIITNSVGSAMAYDFLNNREMNKQSQQQDYKIEDNQNYYEKSTLAGIYKRTIKLYKDFINDIDKEIEKVF